MNKILVICGPTATGKTALALHLAKVFRGELISADSRQVYKGMDILTSKDKPEDVKIRLIDLVKPSEEFSVSQWKMEGEKAIEQTFKEDKLPIVVGGTGLYIKSLSANIETLSVPQNKRLRESLQTKNPGELFDILAQLDPVKAASLNESDKHNPRRLLRAVEVVDWLRGNKNRFRVLKHGNKDFLVIGLTAPKEVLQKRISQRADEWMRSGAKEEAKKLLLDSKITDQAASAIVLPAWREYFTGKQTRDDVADYWKNKDWQYAKRQLTWFKKDRRVNWFDITKPAWQEEVVKLVQAWYNQG